MSKNLLFFGFFLFFKYGGRRRPNFQSLKEKNLQKSRIYHIKRKKNQETMENLTLVFQLSKKKK